MKNLNFITTVFFIVFIGSFWFYHDSKVTQLEFEVEKLVIERDDLKNKILLIEEGLIGLTNGKSTTKPKKTVTKDTTTKSIKVNKSKTKPIVFVETQKPSNDQDVTLGFPNRTGQDLVNSLKLKTEL